MCFKISFQVSVCNTKINTVAKKCILPFNMLVLQFISIWLMLMIAGVLPYPCQKDFDLSRRLKTLEGQTAQLEGNETTIEYSRNGKTHALDFFCWT